MSKRIWKSRILVASLFFGMAFSIEQSEAAEDLWTFNDTYPNEGRVEVQGCGEKAGSIPFLAAQSHALCWISQEGIRELQFIKSDGTSCKLIFNNGTPGSSGTTCIQWENAGSYTVNFSFLQGISPVPAIKVTYPKVDDLPLEMKGTDGGRIVIQDASRQASYPLKNRFETFSDFIFTFTAHSKSCTIHFRSGVKIEEGTSCPTTAQFIPKSNEIIFSSVQGIDPNPALPELTINNEKDKANLLVSGCDGQTMNSGGNGSFSYPIKKPLAEYNQCKFTFTNTSTRLSCHILFLNGLVSDNESDCNYAQYVLKFKSINFNSNKGIEPIPIVKKGALPPPLYTREITFKNNCPYPVWLGLVSGVASKAHYRGSKKYHIGDGSFLCQIENGKEMLWDSDQKVFLEQPCPMGTSCRYVNSEALGAYCFFDLPALKEADPVNRFNEYKLSTGQSKTAVIPVYGDENRVPFNVVYSGGASARMGCEKQGKPSRCDVGNCNDSKNGLSCQFSRGVGDGATIAEFTLQAKDQDYYDISLINGAHMALSMKPTQPGGIDTSPERDTSYKKAYWCKEAGSPNKQGDLPGCSWKFYPPNDGELFYVNVSDPGVENPKACDPAVPCENVNHHCGVSLEWMETHKNTTRSSLYMCGEFLGLDTATNLCGRMSEMPAFKNIEPFKCMTSLRSDPWSGEHQNFSLLNMYLCNSFTDNCVQTQTWYEDTHKLCCGCSAWTTDILPESIVSPGACRLGGAPGSALKQNRDWLDNILPKVKPIKQACPTAYVYQFDDATSTFNCSSTRDSSSATLKGMYNSIDYTITYCPKLEK